MEPLEIEIKFLLSNIADLRNRLFAAGAVTGGRYFEINTRFDDAENSLLRSRSLLRLRKDRRSTMTFKSPPLKPDRDFKIHRELEIEISDVDIGGSILNALGFHPVQVYEKWRETFTLENTVFCIDELPFGTFVEIEGDKSRITEWAARLEFEWRDRILSNYLSLFAILKEKLNLPFNDVTFENFATVDLATLDLQRLFGEFPK